MTLSGTFMVCFCVLFESGQEQGVLILMVGGQANFTT